MDAYIGTKIVMAAPQEGPKGEPGYRVIYPDGYASWSPAATFEAAYREVSRLERTLLEQTDSEHQVAAISDGGSLHDADNPTNMDALVKASQELSKMETDDETVLQSEQETELQPGDAKVQSVCDNYQQDRWSDYWDGHLCANCGNLKRSHERQDPEDCDLDPGG